MTIDEKLQSHISECEECHRAPCPIAADLIEMEEFRRVVAERQYQDTVRLLAEENNPEWYRGCPRSPFFTYFDK